MPRLIELSNKERKLNELAHYRDLVAARLRTCADCGSTTQYCTMCAEAACISARREGTMRYDYYCWQCIVRHHVFHELAGDSPAMRLSDYAWAKAEALYHDTCG